jgi:thiamine biosynthesis lipoprotein
MNTTLAPRLEPRVTESASLAFRAMGSPVEVTLWGDRVIIEQLIALVPARMEILEQSWSRFRADSELSRNNAHAGNGELVISDDLRELATSMLDAATLTQDLFNPTMARIMDALGYSVDFNQITADTVNTINTVNTAAPTSLPGISSPSGIHLRGHHLSLDSGIALDPGALGKGLAGDILCREFRAAGATGVMTNIGGDVVASGTPGLTGTEGTAGWSVGVINERDHNEIIAMVNTDADSLAVATSTTARRVWGEGIHHVIDPRTGTVSTTDLVQATVVTEQGWVAEAFATAAMVLGYNEGHTFLNNMEISHYLVRNNGEVAFA